MPGTFLGVEGSAVNKTEQGPTPHIAYISIEKIVYININNIISINININSIRWGQYLLKVV